MRAVSMAGAVTVETGIRSGFRLFEARFAGR
jgi:hypothetical protein